MFHRMRSTPVRLRLLIGLAALALIGGAACAGDDGGAEGAAIGGPDEVARGAAGADELAEPAPGPQADTMAYGGTALPSVGAEIVKTADVRLEVPHGDFTSAVQDVESAAATYGGFVLSTSLDDASAKRGEIVLRVPSQDFEQALRDIKDAGKLLGQNISGQDVTQEFIDLEARINNLQAQEAVFLDLMDRATTISQTVRIQNHLSNLQLDIEQLQGRLNFLEDRTALGTISVSLVEEGAPAPGGDSAFEVAWERAVDVLEGMGAAAVFLLVVLFPLVLVGLLVVIIIRQLRPRPTT
ncbi:MAG: DUF4349 domain-containing protein [Actinomycetota bacterium]|nr:DUF4349 domain-containing protein [Actinomycetota bacterium]